MKIPFYNLRIVNLSFNVSVIYNLRIVNLSFNVSMITKATPAGMDGALNQPCWMRHG